MFKIINVEARVITLTETLIILNITKTESNNSFILNFKQKKINMARKKHRRLNLQTTELFAWK